MSKGVDQTNARLHVRRDLSAPYYDLSRDLSELR